MWYPIQTENISDKANSDGLVLITAEELQYRTNFREGKMLKKKKRLFLSSNNSYLRAGT